MDPRTSSTASGFSAARNTGENSQAKIEMVFRFWGARGKNADDGLPVQHPGVLALIEDAVAAKRGVFVSAKEQLYVFGLKQPADALVVSRQVQLGLEGFRSKHAEPVAVSIAIDAAVRAGVEETGSSTGQNVEPPHELVTLLKLAKPAQVLLTHDLCQQVESIKGLPLKSFPGRFGVYEYLWTALDKLDLLQSEPQLTLAALPVAAPTVSEKGLTPPVAKLSAPAAEHVSAHSEIVPEKPSAFQSPKILALGGAGVVALVAAVFGVMYLTHRSSTGSGAGPVPGNQNAPVAAPAPTSTLAPTVPAARAAAPSEPEKPVAKPHVTPTQQKHADKAAAYTEEQTQQKSAQPLATAPVVNCILGANASRYVGLAEQARGRGDYANAIRIFREVLDCDPANAAAREGLDKAQRGAQSH